VATATGVTSSVNPSASGQAVTFTADGHVTAADDIVPGSVTFKDGSTVLCNRGGASRDGAAQCTASGLAHRIHPIVAEYAANRSPRGQLVDGAQPRMSRGSLARIANVSTRAQVQTGFNVMIGGFVISGGTSKTVAIRAIGPSLANFG
jgi:hypothetical protein